MDGLRVLVLGGYGFFGARLVQRLLRQRGVEVVLAGRSAAKAEAWIAGVPEETRARLSACALDACDPDLTARIVKLGARVLVHTAGPFQGQDHRVAAACIAAGVHYIDLADGREFVSGITALDAQARAAGVAVQSGASSVPALSSAVVDALASGMARVEHIDIGIAPGNRTERGLSTMQAVLGYCGQEIAPGVVGWSGTWTHAYPAPVGARLLSPCDVPDAALLPARYPGAPRVRFGAGLELRFLHRGMNAMAWLSRRGLLRGWHRHAALLKRMSEWFRHWGTDAGAMHVEVRGQEADGEARMRDWILVAEEGDGPFVPTLAAAALVARLAAGGSLAPGARPCVGLLSWQEILAQAEGLAIRAGPARGIFEHAMGEAYGRLDAAVRAFHDLRGRAELHGEVESEAPASPLAGLLARLLGTPRRAQGAIRFELHCEGERQTWTRHFPRQRMRSRLHRRGATLVETLGPACLVFALAEEGGELRMLLRSMRFLGIPCPRRLLPRIEAREHGTEGRLHFHVRASLPLLGSIAAYRGWLRLPEPA